MSEQAGHPVEDRPEALIERLIDWLEQMADAERKQAMKVLDDPLLDSVCEPHEHDDRMREYEFLRDRLHKIAMGFMGSDPAFDPHGLHDWEATP